MLVMWFVFVVVFVLVIRVVCLILVVKMVLSSDILFLGIFWFILLMC